MSATHSSAHHTHGHGHGHGHDGHGHGHGGDATHFSRKDYVVGFLLAAALTAIPFWLVMHHALPNPAVTAAVVMGLALVQVVVHMIYFLHMNSRAQGGWSLVALLFTVLFVAIAMAGSLWVMYHLNVDMMPMSPQDARMAP
jgi:cytochrome o ubiquinol oxidase operon protein cyoD